MQWILFVFMQSLNFVMFYYLVLHSASRYPLYYINPKHSCTSTIRSTPHALIFSEVTTTMIPKCWQDRYQTHTLLTATTEQTAHIFIIEQKSIS